MKTDRWLLLGVVGLLLVLSVMMVLPYLQFLLAAVIIAFVLHPLQVRLSERIGDTPAAAVLVVLSVLLVLVPFFVVAAVVAGDVTRFFENLADREVDFGAVEEPLASVTGMEVDLESEFYSWVDSTGGSLPDTAVTAFEFVTHFLVGLGVLLFLLFFLVRDGDRFLAWVGDVSPLPGSVTGELVERNRAITKAVLAGHVLVAVVQGVLAGIGFAVLGIPSTVFWTFVMVILAFIPVVGTFVIWAPASVFLFTSGDPVGGIALFVYGTIVVGISDDYLRPVLVDRYAQVSPAVILVGIVGGLSVFGFMGLFVGPIVIGALKETIEVYSDHYGGSP